MPVEAVAARCGIGTAANLCLHLARDAGTTPTAYRAAYQDPAGRSRGKILTTPGSLATGRRLADA